MMDQIGRLYGFNFSIHYSEMCLFWMFWICTVSPWQEAARLIGEQPNLYSENIIHLICHPQGEATFTYKPRLVGEPR